MKTIRVEYKAQDGQDCAVTFDMPTHVQYDRMLADWKTRRNAWMNTELAKRLDADHKEKVGLWEAGGRIGSVPNGNMPDEEYFALADGVPEDDEQKKAAFNRVLLDHAISLISGWEVPAGTPVQKPVAELRDELSRIQRKRFLYEVVGKAVPQLFDLGDQDGKESS